MCVCVRVVYLSVWWQKRPGGWMRIAGGNGIRPSVYLAGWLAGLDTFGQESDGGKSQGEQV